MRFKTMIKQAIFNKLGSLSKYWAHLGNIALMGIVLLSTADVIGRYCFKAPVLGAYELTEYLLVISVLAYMGITQKDKAHVNVDIIFNILPHKAQFVIEKINHTICLLMLILVTWMGVVKTLNLLKSREESILLKIPEYPFAIFMVISFAILTIEFFIDVFGHNKTDKICREDKAK
jgi:TRAP-type transport system small permease protein